jgi:hypothetical protein
MMTSSPRLRLGRLFQSGPTFVLALCLLGLGTPPAGAGGQVGQPDTPGLEKGTGNTQLRSVPALQVKISVDFKQPRAPEVLERLERVTGLRLSLHESVDPNRPVLGSLSLRNVPAWLVMEQLAQAPTVQGRWEALPDGFRLIGTAAPNSVTTADRSARSSSRVRWGLWLSWLVIPPLVVVSALLLLRFRWRRHGSV